MAMNILDIQKSVVKLVENEHKVREIKLSPEIIHMHLASELADVASVLENKDLRPDLYDEKNLREEVVDVVLVSLVLAHFCNVDIEKEISNKLLHASKHGLTKKQIRH